MVDQERSVVGFGGLTLAGFGVGTSLAVALTPVVTLTVTALTVATVVLAVTNVLHLAVTVWAPGPVAVTAVVVALTAIILAR